MTVAGLDGDYRLGTTSQGGQHVGGSGAAGAGGTAGQGGSGADGGTGGGAPSEDCLNGTDDDDDGAVDCDDSDCGGYACVPPAAGALGYLTLVASPGDCPAPGAPQTLSTCDSCTCSIEPGTCNASFTVWNYGGCQNTAHPVTAGSCVGQSDPIIELSLQASTTPVGDGDCKPESDQIPASTATACSVTSPGTCAGANLCLPPWFESARICAMLPDGSPCPADYPDARSMVIDGSQCGCTCQAGSAGCAPAEIQASFADTQCNGALSPVTVGPSCTDVGVVYSFLAPATVPGTLDCTAAGAMLDGSSTVTLCCRP